MLCLNYLNKTVELLFILYNFAIVPSVGTGIKAYVFETQAKNSTAKSPMGAFDSFEIENDIVKVLDALSEY